MSLRKKLDLRSKLDLILFEFMFGVKITLNTDDAKVRVEVRSKSKVN